MTPSDDRGDTTPLGREVVAGLAEIRDRLRAGERIEDMGRVRTLIACESCGRGRRPGRACVVCGWEPPDTPPGPAVGGADGSGGEEEDGR